MGSLIDPYVECGWFARWQEVLDDSDGVFVLWGKEYEKNCERQLYHGGNPVPVLREARAILRRALRDRKFRVIILDPDKDNQGYLALYNDLDRGRTTNVNFPKWARYVVWTSVCCWMLPR